MTKTVRTVGAAMLIRTVVRGRVGHAKARSFSIGDFETGDLTDWGSTPATTSNSLFGVTDGVAFTRGFLPHSGGCEMVFGAFGVGADLIYQDLGATVVGQTYVVDFWLANTAPPIGAPYDQFKVFWNGNADSRHDRQRPRSGTRIVPSSSPG